MLGAGSKRRSAHISAICLERCSSDTPNAWAHDGQNLANALAVDPFDPELHDVYVRVAKDLKDQALTSREENALAVALGRKARPATPGSEGVDSGNPGPNSAPKEGQQ